MEWIKAKKLTEWRHILSGLYSDFVKDSKNYRCKIIDVQPDKNTKEIILIVLISGVKNQLVTYSPQELVSDDSMLREFSSFDVRAITFYALRQVQQEGLFASCSIVAQELLDGKTLFVYRAFSAEKEIQKSAQDLYRDKHLLDKFNRNDLMNIITTAIQEQTINDVQKMMQG